MTGPLEHNSKPILGRCRGWELSFTIAIAFSFSSGLLISISFTFVMGGEKKNQHQLLKKESTWFPINLKDEHFHRSTIRACSPENHQHAHTIIRKVASPEFKAS